jgi:serine/threonine protein kinase
MEERYEIRGKIGQGGLGAVYKGFDTRMNREVAIKRISASGGDAELQEESTRQLIKEAGALASLQHPHIVTVYDVGSDEDGPYVVMELISGKTLDELIERAPLTWPDFRELAMQTQEALIAAQELDLIHSDIKPSNLMLTWLPSGKFQVKIVDFGLATLTQSQSREDLEAMDAVFGSIFFMAPEQFERSPLDARSDLYSMGCVYYQALTGHYPFDGKTGNEVMAAHLNHSVRPLQEIRSDIPLWACDWIMWHINRLPQDRPESARDSLSVFLQNDKNPNPTMSLGAAQAAAPQKRPRLIIPGSEPAPMAAVAQAAPATAAQAPVTLVAPPPTGPLPSAGHAGPALPPAPVPSDPHPPAPPPTASLVPAAVVSSLPDPVDSPESTQTKSAPQPLTPPEGSKPSVHTSSQPLPQSEPELVPLAPGTIKIHGPGTQMVTPTVSAVRVGPVPKRKLSNAAKTTIAAILGVMVILLGWYLLDRSGKNRETKRYNEIITQAAKGDATEVLINTVDLDILLRAATNVFANEQRYVIYKALFLAKATDNTDIDARIVEFATTREMLPDVRETLIRDVLRKRKNPAIVPSLMAYARSTTDVKSAVAALEAVRFMAGDEQFENFLDVIQSTKQEEIRKAASDTLAEIIRKSPNRAAIAEKLASAYETAVEDTVRYSLLHLLGRCSGPKAMDLVRKALEGTEPKDQIAAITALSTWGDGSAFPILTDFIGTTKDESMRNRAFDGAMRFLTDPSLTHDLSAAEEQWNLISSRARTRNEQEKVIRSVTNFDDDWAIKLIEKYIDSDDDRIADVAEKAIDHIKQRRRTREEN